MAKEFELLSKIREIFFFSFTQQQQLLQILLAAAESFSTKVWVFR